MPNERDVFDRLFRDGGRQMRTGDFIREIMVLGLVTFYKFDEVLFREKNGETLSSDDISTIKLSDHRLREIEETVQVALQRHVDQLRPATAFWYGVWQNMVAGFLYSFLLAAVAFTLAYASVDPLKLIGIEIRAIPPASLHGQGQQSAEKPI